MLVLVGGEVARTQGVSFGSQNVGLASAPQPATFTISAGATVGSIAVLTTGVAGKDFANSGGGTCSATTYASNTTCTVNATFTPLAPGVRMGAAVLYDGAGNVLETEPLAGVGNGPLVNFLPAASQTNLGSGLSSAYGIAVDAAGNLYVADTYNSQVKEMLAVGGYTTINILGAGFDYPESVALDGAGNVYVADYYNNAVKEIPPGCTSSACVVSLGTGFVHPSSAAIDSSGNIFVADSGNNAVKEMLASDGYATINTLGSGFNSPTSVAVDVAGNVFVADYLNSAVKEILASSGYTTVNTLGAGFNAPVGVALDPSGNVYVVDAYDSELGEILATGGYATINTLAQPNSPEGLALDGSGNVYVVADGTATVLKVDLADAPSLSFTPTVISTVSSDSPKIVTVENNGNASLTFDVPASGNNPSISGSAFTVDSSGTSACPLITSMSSAGTMAAGSFCLLPVTFTAMAEGANTGTLTLTDNALNVDGTVQTIPLNGIGGDAITVTVGTNPANLQFSVDGSLYSSQQSFNWITGQQHTLAATVQTTPDQKTEYTPTGWSDGTTTATDVITVTAGVTSYTASYSTSYLLSASPNNGAYGTVTPSTFVYYAPGAVVNITATGTGGSFVNWTGSTDIAAPGSAATSITINTPEIITANFVPIVAGTTSAVNLGSEPVGSTTAPQAVTVNIRAGATVGSIAVLTMGFANFDFASVSGGTCTATTYASATSCTVNVTFSPLAAGLREGAVVFFTGSGNTGTVLGNVPIYGTGTGPQVIFSPAPQVSIPRSHVASPYGVAVDGAGDLFIANFGTGTGNGNVEEVPSSGGPRIRVGTGWSNPTGVAVDGAGDLFVADPFGGFVEELPAGGGTQFRVPYNGAPFGIAADAAGNLYIADPSVPQVVEIAAGTGVQTQIGSGWYGPEAVAVDPAGNVYVVDASDATVTQVAAGTGTMTPIGSSWYAPIAVAVDAVGNVYVTDESVGVIELAAGTFTQTTLIPSATVSPSCATVDPLGDIFFGDINSGSTFALLRSQALAVTFPTPTLTGTTDTADGTMTVQVQNDGNASLTMTGLNYPADFPMATGDLNACTSSIVLGAASTCDLPVTFAPQTAGSLSESLTLTDNALNVAGSTQTVTLNGTASPSLTISKGFGATSIAAGGTTTLTFTLNDPATFAQTSVGFSDPFPAGMTVANPSGLSNTCGGTAIANAGGSSVSLSGGSLAAGASCTVVVNITSSTPGVATNTTGAVSSTPGGTGLTASASITVSQITPTVTLNAVPALVNRGTATSLTATFTTISGAPAPTQQMNFYAGATLLGAATLSLSSPTTYTATLSTAAFPSGSQSIVATYPGDSAYLTASSSGQSVYVIANNLWIGNPSGTTAAFSATGTPYLNTPVSAGGTGVAIDSAGNIWSLNASGSVAKLTNTGGVTNAGYSGGGISTPTSLAIDGSGQVWITNSNNSISVFGSNGSPVSTTAYTGGSLSSPTSVAIDISGNLWIANSGSNSVTEVLGVATPTVPLATGVANNAPATAP
jgi:sugar lactone lactonase YvrE